MSAWPTSRDTQRSTARRHLRVALYLIGTVGAAYLLAALAVLPLHGRVQGLVFIVVALSAASIAGALTPRRATPYAREDRS